MDAKTRQIFRRYLTAKGTGDVPQQSSIRRHRRRHISVSCFAETTRQITPGLRLWEKEGFNEGFEWMLKQHRYFTDISQLKVQVKCSSKAVFVDTNAAIFCFLFCRVNKTNHAQPTSMGKRGFNEGFEWTLKQHRCFAHISQPTVQVMCSSKALFVANDAAIFLFPVSPRRPDKSRPAYIYVKTGV